MERFRKIEGGPDPLVEKLIESSLAHGVKFDEGQNAVVLEVRPEDLDDDLRQQFFSGTDGKMSNDPFVSKVLRVFNAGHSVKEAKSQIEAGEILAASSGEHEGQLAKVPEVYFYEDITISDQGLKDKLAKAGVESIGGRLGVLLMYRVQGVDFLNYLLQEAIKRCPQEEAEKRSTISFAQAALNKDWRAMSTEETFKVASLLIGFEESERVQLSPNNRARLIDYLQRHGFVLDPMILEKIRRSIKILNQGGFYHNDLTERNTMLEFDQNGNVVTPYVIDFEKAGDTMDEDFGGDMAILGNYQTLTRRQEESIQQTIDKDLLGIEKLRENLFRKRPAEYKRIEDSVLDVLRSSNETSLLTNESTTLTEASRLFGDNYYEIIAAILLKLAVEHGDLVKKYIAVRATNKKINPRFFNLLARVNNRI